MGSIFSLCYPQSEPSPRRPQETFRLECANSGVFLVIASEKEGGESPADASAEWTRLAERWTSLAESGELPGFDPETMEIKPMRTNPAWGKDMGPHFSLVLVTGTCSADKDGKEDQHVVSDDGKKKSITPEVCVRLPRRRMTLFTAT